jgi:hypothetical protein
MKRYRLLAAVLLAVGLAATAAAITIPKVTYTDTRLKNGLRVIISSDRAAPIVSVAVAYNVGSRNERKGRTGFAHLFEHLMFKGSENVADGELAGLIENYGGSHNGQTDKDHTIYFEQVPSNQLDMVLFLEADRMRSMLAKQPADRPPSMSAVITLLDEFKAEGSSTTILNNTANARGHFAEPQLSRELLVSNTNSGSAPVDRRTATSVTEENPALTDTTAFTNLDVQTESHVSPAVAHANRPIRRGPELRYSRWMLASVAAIAFLAIVIGRLIIGDHFHPKSSDADVQSGEHYSQSAQSNSTMPSANDSPAQLGTMLTDYALAFDGVSSRVHVPNLSYKGDTPITLEFTLRRDAADGKSAKLLSFPWGGMSISADHRLLIRAWDPAVQKDARELISPQRVPPAM